MHRTGNATSRWGLPIIGLAALFSVACSNRDPILGGGAGIKDPPTVVAVLPADHATAVPAQGAIITATFSEPVGALTGGASFTLTCAVPGANPTGTVTLDAGSLTATYTLPGSGALLPLTLYTATVAGAISLDSGLAMASPKVWTFTTGTDQVRPRVALTVPATTLPPMTGVDTNSAISAAFTEAMSPATLTGTSFTVTGPGLTAVAGSVTYASQTAIFTPAALLVANTTYTATITSSATDLAGNGLAGNQSALPGASNYVWTFTTGLGADTTRPRVTLTLPATTIPGPTLNVAPNTAITATFTEPMNAATISAASMTLTGPGSTIVNGAVTYQTASQTAILVPSAVLLAGTTYTATLTQAAHDLAGNALAGNQAALPAASDYVWTFTTGLAVDSVAPTIILENPADAATGVAINTAVNATFSEAMDMSAATFTLQQAGPPLGIALAGSFSYDALTRIATFIPTSPLLANTQYTATFTGAKDLAGNNLIAGTLPNPWNFTTGSGIAPPPAIALGSAATYGIMATSAITNTGAATIINGDVALEPGTSNGLLPLQVNGAIHINDSASHQARADLLAGYNTAKTLPPGVTIAGGADLGALYPLGMAPGTYTSGSTMLVSTPLVLDAGGNANATWVFQIGSSLTTTANVSLANGANAKNIFWVSTLDSTIGVGSIFYGTIISGRDVTAKTGAVINGRIMAGATLAGTIALDTNTVNVPTP